MNGPVSYQLDEGIATLTMDDGKVNAISTAMLAALNGALDRAAADNALVVIAGREKVFSAGFDLSILSKGDAEAHALLRGGFELALRVFSFPKPVVVACTGHALAMGAFIALSADHRIGAEGPSKIGANEVAIGMTMPHFAIALCRHRLANECLNRAVLNAEIFSPQSAVTAGFLDEVVTAGVVQAAQTKARQLAKLNLGSYETTKRRLRSDLFKTMREAIEKDDHNFRSNHPDKV